MNWYPKSLLGRRYAPCFLFCVRKVKLYYEMHRLPLLAVACLLKYTGGLRFSMYEIVKDFPDAIIFEEEGPFISLYQPTHRHSPGSKQDSIVFKNLIQRIENSLKLKHKMRDINSIMKPFYEIKNDKSFWNNTLDGLAILASPNRCIVYKLPRPVQELAIVTDSHHIKPLIRHFQSADKYQLLGLSRSEFALYEGNRYGFKKIEMTPETPRTVEEVLGKELTEPHQTHRSSGGAGGSSAFHGHGGKRDEVDKDIEKFFRYVDKFVLENYSKLSKSPLILVSLAEYHTIFKKISHNPYLMEEGIKDSYDSFDMNQLKENAWKIIEPTYLEKTKILVDSYEQARADSLGSDDLTEVAKAVLEKRVGMLLIDDNSLISGKYGDGLDNLAGLVFKSRGEVVVLPTERMPSDTGVAGTYRY